MIGPNSRFAANDDDIYDDVRRVAGKLLAWDGTYDRYSGDRIGKGYAVGGKVMGLKLGTPSYGFDYANRVARWIQALPTNVEYLGSWLDPDTGILHIDAVDLVEDREEAVSTGRTRGELAIFCFATATAIALGG